MVSDSETIRANTEVLIVEDDLNTATALQKLLERAGYRSEFSLSLTAALDHTRAQKPRIVLLDLSLPDGQGENVVSTFKQLGANEIIVISGSGDPERTRQCLRQGAFDFIEKPVNAKSLIRAVRRADGARRLQLTHSIDYPLELKPGLGSLEGRSIASQKMLEQIRQIARLPEYNVLITGQSGVLKADVAAIIHRYSGRTGPALYVNCASENDEQAQHRFFGGQLEGNNTDNDADNDADNDEGNLESGDVSSQRPGYLHKAHLGTLVLDDISSLPIVIQKGLAEFVESGEAMVEMALTPTKLDCVLVGVLREPIDTAIDADRLYKPLLDILSSHTIAVPPLVDRQDDIEFFARQAVEQLNKVFSTEKSLSVEIVDYMKSYYWPGNLVELKNFVFDAYRATEAGDEMNPDISWFHSIDDEANDNILPFVGQTFRDVEKQLIEATLVSVDHNKRKAAGILGISVKKLYNRLAEYNK